MKNWKTTLTGCIAAACVAAKPILDGSGYHVDIKTGAELIFAIVLAVNAFMQKDFDATGKPNDK